MLTASLASAQRYIGTLDIDGYTRKHVEVKLEKGTRGTATLSMRNVKFARMMPVKVDVDVPGVALADGRLQGDGIVPTSKGKPYERHKVTRLVGKADGQQLDFRCRMGNKSVTFSGKLMQR